MLSFTSLALIDRSIAIRHQKGHKVSDRVAALWKSRPNPRAPDPDKDFAELNILNGHHALTVTLRSDWAADTTIDGRPNSDAVAWYLRKHASIGLSPLAITAGGWEWVVNGVPKPDP